MGLKDWSKEEITEVLDTAAAMKDILGRDVKKVPALRGRSVATLFYEPSTRTRASFELAAKYMSADTVSLTASASSIAKGESLLDTIWTIEAMGVDAVVLRHPVPGSSLQVALHTRMHVVNAGDGAHEHPTQALLDMYTVREKLGKVEGLTLAIVGDIAHSRVARSNIWAWQKMGAKVRVVGPPTLIPVDIDQTGVQVCWDLEAGLRSADVIMGLRIQLERQARGFFPSLAEYTSFYGLTAETIQSLNPSALILHPGPVNRGVEITDEVLASPNAAINEQVTNGVAVRMALLYLLLGGGKGDGFAS